MCIAIPMKIIKINSDDTAQAVIHGNEMTVNVALVDVKVGDFVLIHAGCAMQVLTKDSAQEILDIFSELEDEFENDARKSD